MKTVFSFLFGAAAVVLLGFGLWNLGGIVVSLVPPGEYAGLIKLAVIVTLILLFGVIIIGAAMLAGAAGAAIGLGVGLFFEWAWGFLERAWDCAFPPVKVGHKFQHVQTGIIFITTDLYHDEIGFLIVSLVSDRPYSGDISHCWRWFVLERDLKNGTFIRL